MVQDAFDRLILAAGLPVRMVSMLRGYAKYLRQLGMSNSFGFLAEALAAANKRVSNLLAKFEAKLPEAVEPRWFDNATEFSLYSAIQQAEQAVQPLAAARQYREALERLAHLRGPVDAFFEAVLVNAEDASVRANRYALLARLRGLFLGVADISALG